MADTLQEMAAQIAAARQIYEPQLFRDPNIVGVGSGYKRQAGEATGVPALIVFVATKLPANKVSASRLLPRRLEFYVPLAEANLQVVTDVIEVGPISALSYTGHYRPAPGGVSVGHPCVTAGTLGGYVQDRETGELLLLSNHHVLAGQNNGYPGDPILQQAPLDGGDQADVFARLRRAVPLDFSTSGGNLVDAAVACPEDADMADLAIMGLGAGPNATGTAQVGMPVQKTGRSSEHTTGGQIISVDTTFWVDYAYGGAHKAGFRDTIVVLGSAGFSQPGDSGSLMLSDEPDPKLVGLLFAGNASGSFTLANHIHHVFNLLGVDLVSALAEVIRGTSWEFRSDQLQTLKEKVLAPLPDGQRYLALLQRHNAELWRILRRQPDLRDQASRLLVPLLNAFFTDADPRDMVFDHAYFAELRALVQGLNQRASLPLQKALNWIYADLARFEGKNIAGILQELTEPTSIQPPSTAGPQDRQVIRLPGVRSGSRVPVAS